MPEPNERLFEPALEASTDPIALFRLWLEAATATEPNDPNAMAIATATPEAHPSVRMVLMKGLDDRGFAFYTNTDSQKGAELLANPHASAVFHWKTQRRQVRITGPTTELPEADADHYFHTRSRASQINAAASRQSRPVPDRATLEAEAKAVAEANPGQIPLPWNWRGFAIQPATIEFWQDGPDRLHDRIVYTRTGSAWTRTRLYP
jgi:pyridoxamine 5'-phosphate oxidase